MPNATQRTASNFGMYNGQVVSLNTYQSIMRRDVDLLTKGGKSIALFAEDCQRAAESLTSKNRVSLDKSRYDEFAKKDSRFAATITDPGWDGITRTDDFIQELIASAPFLSESELVHKITGYKGEIRIPGFASEVCFQDFVCDFTPSGDFTGQVKKVTPTLIKVEGEMCWKDLLGTFADMELNRLNILGWELPTAYSEVWMSMLLQKIKVALERAFFLGTTGDPASLGFTGSGNYGVCGLDGKVTGILAQLEAEGGYIQVDIPASITTTNAVQAFDTVYNSMYDLNEALASLDDSQLCFLCHPSTFSKYRIQIQNQNTAQNINTNFIDKLYNKSVKIETSLWFPKDQIILTHKALPNGRQAPFGYITNNENDSSSFEIDRVTNLGKTMGFSLAFAYATVPMQLSGSPVNEQNVIWGKA